MALAFMLPVRETAPVWVPSNRYVLVLSTAPMGLPSQTITPSAMLTLTDTVLPAVSTVNVP